MATESPTYVVGVDLGGTRLRAALADREGKILRQRAVATRAAEGRDAVIARIAAEIRAVAEPLPLSDVAAVAVAVPAPVNPATGVVYNPPNLPGWGEVPLKSILEGELGCPVALGNDANLAALAEHAFGSGRGAAHLVYLTVSTGIGGGVVVGNRLLLGATGGAGEIGHMTIDEHGPRCPCGNPGCLEAMASGTAIAREAARRVAAGAPSSLATDPGLQQIVAESVVRAAQAGDALSREVIDWAAYNLGVGLTNVLHLFDPEIVIIGGGVSNAWDLLLPGMIRAIEERAMPSYARRRKIVRSELGDNVGLLGAIALGLGHSG